MESHMYKAVIMNADNQHPLPTAKEIQAYLRKTSKLLYGNDKRKSINTPYPDIIHLVMYSFSTFQEAITKNERDYQDRKELYIFDDKVNVMQFFLKYGGSIDCHFSLDDAIIHSMNHCSWSFGHLERYKKSVVQNAESSQFFIDKQIGNAKLHKSFPKFIKATDDYIKKIDAAMKEIEDEAVLLFKSGW